MTVIGLNRNLPQRYVAEPQIHLGSFIEIDVATYEEDEADLPAAGEMGNEGGVAIATYANRATDLAGMEEYEVYGSTTLNRAAGSWSLGCLKIRSTYSRALR